MANVKKLTRILDKLVQVGPSYLDQTLRSYVTENKEYRLYTDYHPDSHPGGEGTANTYAIFSYFSSGIYKTEEERETDILIVAGGGGGSIGNASGGSGGGEVLEIRGAKLPAGSYVITVGAGGGGADYPLNTGSFPIATTDGRGGEGNESKISTTSGQFPLIASGGGIGGFRQTDTDPLEGGNGGGAGGSDITDGLGLGRYVGADPIQHTITSPYTSGTPYLEGTVVSYQNKGGDSDAYDTGNDAADSYAPGGGGGSGTAGGLGVKTRGGNGGDGITLDWVNEVFLKTYKFNGNIYWGAGGGAAGMADTEPGDGGLGGGGGGASYRSTNPTDPDSLTFWNGKGGLSGYNQGYDAAYMKGGAGGQNTGSGAGGSQSVTSAVHAQRILTKGPNGGSGFVLIRVKMNDIV